MQIRTGIEALIHLYNFINSKLLKFELKLRRNGTEIEFSQDGNWTLLPNALHEVMIIPDNFKSGYVRKSDLIKLYNSVAFIVDRKGRVPDCYMESYIVPEKFGFSIWSRYPHLDKPGVRKVQEFKFNVRNKLGLKI